MKYYWKLVATAVLVLQNAGLALLMKYTQQHTHTAHVRVQILLAEFVKVLLGFAAHRWNYGEFKLCNMYIPLSQVVRCSVPVFLYIIQNNLSFYAAKLLSIAILQAIIQLKLMFAAVFAVVFLNKSMNREQWFSLLFIVCGAAVVCLDGRGCESTTQQQLSVTGIITAVSITVLSGFTGCYTEKILKTQNVCPWIQSSLIAAMSALFLVCTLSYEHAFDMNSTLREGFFINFSPLVWLLVFNLSAGGFLVVLVIKLLGNVIKGIAVVISLLVSSVLSTFLFDAPFSMLLGIGMLMISSATYQYTEATASQTHL